MPIIILIVIPTMPAQVPKIICSVPMFLWLVNAKHPRPIATTIQPMPARAVLCTTRSFHKP